MTYKTRFQYLLDKAKDIAHGQALLNPGAGGLPVLFFFTDPARTPHPEDIAAHLPEGCGIVYRHFGESHAPQRGRLLRRIAQDNGLILLIGDDEALAVECEAHGLHLPERHLAQAPDIRARHPGWILTGACHGMDALKLAGVNSLKAAFVSPVFASHSPSAAIAEPLGVKGVRALVDAASLPLYGLGGINCDTIANLRDSGLAGVGAVDAFSLRD